MRMEADGFWDIAAALLKYKEMRDEGKSFEGEEEAAESEKLEEEEEEQEDEYQYYDFGDE